MQNLPFDHLFCNFIPGQSLSGKLGTLVIEHAELSREERTLTLWLFSETYLMVLLFHLAPKHGTCLHTCSIS